MGRLIGVDEAGRGPVIGSLFVGAVSVPDRRVLPESVDDSKVLTPATRGELAKQLTDQDAIRTTVAELTVETIDESHRSLTELIAETFATVINRLGEPGDRVITDAGEADTDRFDHRVEQHLTTLVDFKSQIKADANDPLVGAASILAKEAREAHVRELTTAYGQIGSGYPSDPKTRRFLVEYVEETNELPACARRSWSTSQDVLAAVAQSSFDEFIRMDHPE